MELILTDPGLGGKHSGEYISKQRSSTGQGPQASAWLKMKLFLYRKQIDGTVERKIKNRFRNFVLSKRHII